MKESMQEKEWRGQFGDEYQERSPGSANQNTHFFHEIIERNFALAECKTVLEFGCGTGANLEAIGRILPHAMMTGVDVNLSAIMAATNRVHAERMRMIHGSLHSYTRVRQSDLVLTKGVLIHIHPARLPSAYEIIYRTSRRWLLVCEYYSPQPTEIKYRDRTAMLWKRDFAGEMLDKYDTLRLVDYGFAYHRASEKRSTRQDDITWFLMEKREAPCGQ